MEISISSKTLKVAAIVFVSFISLVFLQSLIKSKEIDDDCVEGVCGVEEMEDEKITVEKIEVIHFHATQQCWSCIELGRLAQLTLEKRFPEELESGFIEFKEVNVELPENSDIVEKYQASGSSLFINYIYDGQNHIEEDVQAWRLLGSEIQFRKYFGDKLEQYL